MREDTNEKVTFYAVARGREIGIYENWSDCNEQVYRYPDAKYEKFKNFHQAVQYLYQALKDHCMAIRYLTSDGKSMHFQNMRKLCNYAIYIRPKEKKMKRVAFEFTEIMRDEVSRGLRNIFRNNLRMIILYGSVARYENVKESDINIAVVLEKEMDQATRDKLTQFAEWMQTFFGQEFSFVDVLRGDARKSKSNPLYRAIWKDGVPIWIAWPGYEDCYC